MSFRIGECSSCGANYKLPASFAADQARCKNCGGVVQIGKAGEPAAPKAAASTPTEDLKEVTRPKKKSSGPSMKERLMAERKAAEAAAAKPAAAKPAPAKPATAKAPAPKPAATESKAPAKSSSSRRSRSGSRRADGDSGDEGGKEKGGSRRRRSAPEKKKAPVGGMIAMVLMVAVLGAAGYFYMNRGEEDSAEAADGTTEDVVMNTSDADGEAAGTDGEGTEPIVKDAEDGDEADGAAEDGSEETLTAVAKPKKEAKAGDPDTVDLTLIEDYGPIAGCDEARFLELQELAAVMVDPEAGAAGNRARNKLVEAGKEAFPAVFNALKALDLTDNDQFRSADVCQKALESLCNGNNFGWKYPSQEPVKFHYFDKKVIVAWSKAWDQAKDNDGAWAKLAKLDSLPAKEEEEVGEDDDTADALDGLDDL
ncbi:MAG: hypothetical protein ACI8X5_000414 [Planctomycetota bacterium]|jgi:hypothetical protein